MKILVVDDEKDIQTLFVQQFRKEIRSGEMELVFAYSGEEALKYLNETTNPEAILILSDINMPGMNGLVLLEKVKQKYKTPPPVVMMITAYGDKENYSIAQRLGADDFLSKPIDFPGLKEKLKKLKP
jgi:two-component system, chemotaxis family, chemotaxis protein CheY